MGRLGRGTGRPNPSCETKFSGANGHREILIFPVQLTTSRIGNLTRLIHTLLNVMTIFLFFLRTSSARGGGGGGRCQTFSFSFFPCSADHERDWPPCKVVFFGLATNALNVRNNNNNNYIYYMEPDTP